MYLLDWQALQHLALPWFTPSLQSFRAEALVICLLLSSISLSLFFSTFFIIIIIFTRVNLSPLGLEDVLASPYISLSSCSSVSLVLITAISSSPRGKSPSLLLTSSWINAWCRRMTGDSELPRTDQVSGGRSREGGVNKYLTLSTFRMHTGFCNYSPMQDSTQHCIIWEHTIYIEPCVYCNGLVFHWQAFEFQ